MMYSWKPSFEVLETREVPAAMGLIGLTPQVIYPPSDESTLPPPPPPPPPATIVIVSPPTTPYTP